MDANQIHAALQNHEYPTEEILVELCRVARNNPVVGHALAAWSHGQCTFAVALAQVAVVLADANENLIKKFVAGELGQPVILMTEAEPPQKRKKAGV